MSNISTSRPEPPVAPRPIIDALVRLIRDQVPGQTVCAIVTARVLEKVVDIIRKNIVGLLGGSLMAAGLAVLLPSLAVAVINALGWTVSGVVAGSIAAAIQSSFYGAFTTGVFSTLQSFGATAVIASPAGLAVGGITLVVGAGCLGYWLYKKERARRASESASGSSDSDTGPSPSLANAVVRKSSEFNFFDLFGPKSKPKSE